MNTTTITNIIENFDELSIEDKEYALKIFEKNIAESKREELVKRVKEAKQDYSSGNVKKGNLQDLYKDLEDN